MNAIPDYIVRRLRTPAPANCAIVSGSTPVIAFGDPRTARVATLGLNPSRREFLDRHGRELDGPERRLETLRSLRVDNLATAPDNVLERAFESCCRYFEGNPYRTWFDRLEEVLQRVGASYYDGSACHLDLIQWATDPVWGRLPDAGARSQLLSADGPFLLEQLQREDIRLLLLNGRAVTQHLSELAAVRLSEVQGLDGPGSRRTGLYVGQLPGPVQVIGWSLNLQSSFGVTRALRAELASSVANLSEAARLESAMDRDV